MYSFNLSSYYDSSKNSFLSKYYEQYLKDFLIGYPLYDAYLIFIRELGNNYSIDEDKLRQTRIVFNTKDRIRFIKTTTLIRELKKLKPSFDKNSSNIRKYIDDVSKKYQPKVNNENDIKGLIEEIDCACKGIIYKVDKTLDDSNNYNKKEYSAAKEIRREIREWKITITGTFNEKTKKITLYMLPICDSSNPSICLLATYAHELFHAFHFYASNNCFLTEWIDRDVDKFVKEGMARYMELGFLRRNDDADAKIYADNLECYLNGYDIKNDPYAVYKMYSRNDGFLIEIFNTSLIDIGDAYNLLIMEYY